MTPYDRRIPKIRISTRRALELKENRSQILISDILKSPFCVSTFFRFIVRIDSWDVDSFYPSGHFVRLLGPYGNIETETNVVLVENGISCMTFSDGQVCCVLELFRCLSIMLLCCSLKNCQSTLLKSRGRWIWKKLGEEEI